MAGLIDDAELFSPTERDFDGDGMPTPVTEDYNNNGQLDFGLRGRAQNDASHDWWLDFLRSRDGEHPESGLVLPGQPTVLDSSDPTRQVAGSRPFRDPGVLATGDPTLGSIEDSILRTHPDSAAAGLERMLFELGTSTDADNGQLASGAPFDQHVRRRILSKIAGNTTTRSNVFVVFLSVQFHEAYEDPATGAIRVGGRIDLNNDGQRDDGHRGFFIVDRSAAEEAYDPRTGTFDWRVLVKHRLTIN